MLKKVTNRELRSANHELVTYKLLVKSERVALIVKDKDSLLKKRLS